MMDVHDGASPERQGAGEAEPEPPRSMVLDVSVEDGIWGCAEEAERLVIQAAEAVVSHLGQEQAEAAILLSSDARVRELNRVYRGADKPTNVLSFPSLAPSLAPGTARFLGDIIIAGETVAREAEQEGRPLAHHLQHLVVHGLLHLLGYDHERDDEAREMEQLEAEILGRIGVPDPYAETA
jgi:probable rRNA maturation factor